MFDSQGSELYDSRMTTTKLQMKAAKYQQAERHLAQRREELYSEIRTSHADGDSLRKIAAEVGLTFVRIGQIVRGE